jgi:steroid-24-oyl-CoA synthetase
MTDGIRTRREAIAELSAPGRHFELTEETVQGVPCEVFRNAPKTMRDLIENTRQFERCEYLTYENEHYSYGDIYRRSANLAHVLVDEYHVKNGDRVAIGARNYPEWVIAFLAITSVGGIAVALNALWNAEELAYGLELTETKILIADRERIERLEDRLEALDLKVLAIRCDGFSSHRIRSFDKVMEGRFETSYPPAQIDSDDDALIIFTSGSTGHPKGAVSTHRAAIHAIMSWDFDAEIAYFRGGLERPKEPEELEISLLMAVPLFHVSGCHVGMLQAMLRGRKLVLMYKWDVMEGLDIIERDQITHFVAVPTMTGDLVKAAAEHGRSLTSLLSVGGGGAPRSAKQVKDIDAVFENAAPGTGWGMTETNAIGAGIGGEDYLNRPLSSGICSAVLEMRVTNDDDVDVRRGEAGHLLIRGSSMFREYWNRPDANKDAFVDGWFRTGDIARIDEEDFLFIVDRAKDIVIRGGENIGCGEVEDAIYTHPAVNEVVVFGVPDERLGEKLAAMVITAKGKHLNTEDLQAHLGDHLANFQIPSHVYFSTDPLPRIASGKFNKRSVRAEILERHFKDH